LFLALDHRGRAFKPIGREFLGKLDVDISVFARPKFPQPKRVLFGCHEAAMRNGVANMDDPYVHAARGGPRTAVFRRGNSRSLAMLAAMRRASSW
jgi:hypothetical protein